MARSKHSQANFVNRFEVRRKQPQETRTENCGNRSFVRHGHFTLRFCENLYFDRFNTKITVRKHGRTQINTQVLNGSRFILFLFF